MTVKLDLADNTTEVFETENFKVSTPEQMHAAICRIRIYTNGRLIYKWARKKIREYKKYYVPPKTEQKLEQAQD